MTADDTRLAMAKLERLVIGSAEATTLQSRNELATPEAEPQLPYSGKRPVYSLLNLVAAVGLEL